MFSKFKTIFLLSAFFAFAASAEAQVFHGPRDLSNPLGGGVANRFATYGYSTSSDCKTASEDAIVNAEVLCEVNGGTPSAGQCLIAKPPAYLVPKGDGCTVLCWVKCVYPDRRD